MKDYRSKYPEQFMKNLRSYGKAPFDIAVIHGGPGAPGYMAPVALELSSGMGVLEPLQTESSLEGQIQELHDVLINNANLPVKLIGSSWGAWLIFIFTAEYPSFVKKLILIGSGPFEEKYSLNILKTRLERLSEKERREALFFMTVLEELNNDQDKNTILDQLGNLFTKADAYDPLTLNTSDLEVQFHIYQSVWSDAANLRQSGELLKLGKQIQCPVLAIHGDYDPHPAEGVQKPLSTVLKHFQFILLKNCGHLPWIEKEARDKFYKILKKDLRMP